MLTFAQALSRDTNAHDFTRGAVVHNTRSCEVRELGEQELRQRAPSVFAESAASDVSGRYLFLPTWEILQRIKHDTGLVPVRIAEQRCRERDGMFARHEIVLRQPGQQDMKEWRVGDTVFECRLTNSHDRSSAYALDPGLFRFACNNGLLVPDSMLPGVRVKHVGDREIIGNIIDGCVRVLHDAPTMQNRIEHMRSHVWSDGEQVAFAKAAALLRWEEGKEVVQAERLLGVRRTDDKGNDEWTVLNRVQENIIKGGIHDVKREPGKRARRVTSRGVESIPENQRINKALFTLAAEMRRIKEAA
jgi:Domain of unknown function (DUF932)